MARKSNKRNQSDSGDGQGERSSFRGGEISIEEVLDRAFMKLDAALDQVVRYTSELQMGPLLPLNQSRARNVARVLAADIRRVALSANLARRAAGTVFKAEIAGLGSLRDRVAATRRFAVRDKWCTAQIAEMRQGLLVAVRRALYWNARFQHPTARLFPKLPPLPPPSIEKVWEDLQYHFIGGVWVPIRKVKFNFKIFGRKLNFAVVSFPHFPDWTPEPKILVSSGEEAFDGLGLHALDTIGPQVGNPVLPGGATRPAVTFNGYMKIIYTDGIPPDCRVQYRTVWYPSWSFRPNGGNWRDVTLGGNPGNPRPDPPGGGPSYGVAPGTAVFADFPSWWFAPGLAECAYLVRNDLFRTWVVQICPDSTTVIGYWEWRFRYVLHQGASEVENVTTQPGNGPAGVPDPPGGWPDAPTSGPTNFVPAVSAPAQATADYNAAFP